MNEILEIIKKRKSIRKYSDVPLPEDVIDSILEAAKHAPSAKNMQQLEYKVITKKDFIMEISEKIVDVIKKEVPPMKVRDEPDSIFHGAPLVIIITGPRENKWIDSDAALAVQNMMLYATSIGLGSCFIGMAKFIDKDKDMMKKLKIDDTKRIAAAVICGYTDEDPAPQEKRLKAEFWR